MVVKGISLAYGDCSCLMSRDIVKDMLPDIRRGIDMIGKAIIPIPAIEKMSGPVKREGNS